MAVVWGILYGLEVDICDDDKGENQLDATVTVYW
jgi:hypothetical protein